MIVMSRARQDRFLGVRQRTTTAVARRRVGTCSRRQEWVDITRWIKHHRLRHS